MKLKLRTLNVLFLIVHKDVNEFAQEFINSLGKDNDWISFGHEYVFPKDQIISCEFIIYEEYNNRLGSIENEGR